MTSRPTPASGSVSESVDHDQPAADDQIQALRSVVHEMKNPNPDKTTVSVGEALLRYAKRIEEIIAQKI